ncbi:MAG: TRIC cation channel family protein [Caulobacteraceae bacterium]
MGVLTACFGGVLRDVLSEQPSVLLRREIYVTAAIAAASTYVAMAWLGAGLPYSIMGGVLAGLVLRGGALLKGWKLPVPDPGPPTDAGG